MFAGVNAIILNSEETIVTGLMSREGEEVSTLAVRVQLLLPVYMFLLCVVKKYVVSAYFVCVL